MSKQLTLGTGFEKYTKTTRGAQFLSEMDRIIPWIELCELIAPAYPVAGNGRPPRELEMMLRIYFLQQWFNLSDPAAEDGLYDSVAMRRFVGLDLAQSPAPDETTICRFRHLLERNNLGEALFQYVLEYLEAHGIKVGKGTIVDASIINAPSSTKNKDKRCDPDMHQTKKGNQWYFGMKAHIGVDSRTKLIHAVAATAANVHDAICLPDLLHGEETKVWGDAAYQGQGEVIKDCAPNAQDITHRRYRRPGQGRASVSDYQARLRLCDDAVSRIGEERASIVRDVRIGELVPDATAIVANGLRSIRLAYRSTAENGENSA